MNTKHRQTHWLKNTGWGFFLSVFLPILILGGVFALKGIYPGSLKTLLASDSAAQGSSFLASFNNALHGKQGFLYTWSGSLGLNFWSLMAYYINSLFSFVVYFFDNYDIPDAMYMMLLLRFGAMGGAFWWMSKSLFELRQWQKVLLSVAYALSGFSLANSPQQMWLDGLIYLPLVVLGIHRVMDERKPMCLFVSSLLLFLSNFYMGFMIGVFTFLYACCRYWSNPKRYKGTFLSYTVTSLLAGGASMVTILPTVLDLVHNGERLDSLDSWLTPDTGPWDLVVKTMAGVYDTTRFESAPFLYFSLIGLVGCLFYFVNRHIPCRNKWLFGSLFFFLGLSVYLEPLNLFWHGFHSPNMFLFRFSFLFSFLGLLLAGYGFEKLTKKDVETLMNFFLILLVVYVIALFVANKRRYMYVTRPILLWNAVFLLLYVGFCVWYQKGKGRRFLLPFLLMVVFTGEMTFNTWQLITGINQDWPYPHRGFYTKFYKSTQQLVEKTQKNAGPFYRLANVDSKSSNESFVYGYSGVSMFSSIRNRNSSSYLNDLGFRSNGTNLNIRYQNNTILMDALLGIKYNLAQKDVQKYGFTLQETAQKQQLYENKNALPLGLLTDKGIFAKDVANDQVELFQYLSKESTPLFRFAEVKTVKTENVDMKEENDSVTYSSTSPNQLRKVVMEIQIPAHTQAYLKLDNPYTNLDIGLTIDGKTRVTEGVLTGQYYNLGYYDKQTTVKATMTLFGTESLMLAKPMAVFLDIPTFEKDIQALKKQGVEFTTTHQGAQAKIALKKEQVLFTTIPYDKGWHAYLDGKEVPIQAMKDAFVAISLPKGNHTLQLVFRPQGLSLGVILLISCFGLFILYNWWETKGRYKQEKKEKLDETTASSITH